MIDYGWEAYRTGRSAARTTGTRHAVDGMSHLCGAPEMECMQKRIESLIHLGPWIPGHPENCVKCVKAMALVGVA